MTWWAWLWITALAIVTVAGMWDDRKDRRPVWYIAAGGLSGAICVVSVLAYFTSPVAEALGRWLLPLAFTSAVWLVIELTTDYYSIRSEPHAIDSEDGTTAAIGVGLAFALFAPAVGMAGQGRSGSMCRSFQSPLPQRMAMSTCSPRR